MRPCNETEAANDRWYRIQVIREMKKNGWSIEHTRKHFRHGYGTVKRWLEQYEADVLEASNDDNDQHINWVVDRPKCLECIRLEAKLEVYKAIVERYLGVSI